MRIKSVLILIVLLVGSLTNIEAQERMCPKCNPPRVISKCPYKGNHPTPPKPQYCSKCSPKRLLSNCPYGGKHPNPNIGYDVKFTCNVLDADLYIDSIYYGKASGNRFLKDGTHVVTIKAKGHEDLTRDINVGPSSKNFSFELCQVGESKLVIDINGSEHLTLILVEGGTFTMGATREQYNFTSEYSDENPTPQVTLSDYYIGETEVTYIQWHSIMGTWPGRHAPDLPVTNVSYNDILLFIARLDTITNHQYNFYLPTEAQWEYAARGGNRSKHTIFSGSNDIDSVAWIACNTNKKDTLMFSDKPKNLGSKYYREYNNGSLWSNINGEGYYYKTDAIHYCQKVKMRKPNELGIYDMSGNVAEWCSDYYGKYIYKAQTDPTGPANGNKCVVRGGSACSEEAGCRVSSRYSFDKSTSLPDLGFRIAMTPKK